ncbi:MAG: DUF3822 family protein [Prevotella sp.]|nr:DUF3822 family protein [Prevotella sp.]
MGTEQEDQLKIANSATSQRITIRVGRGTLSFSMPGNDGNVVFEPYVVKSGISMAANLREAFRTSDLLLQAPRRARVLVDSDVLMVPIELFEVGDMDQWHHHAYPRKEQDAIYYNVLPDLNAVSVFSMNKDLRLVIDDHFQDVRLLSVITPVWRHLHQRSYTGTRHKLYGYFHEQRLEVFSYQQNRFKFCNSFGAKEAHDALYFLLYVWKQLQLQPQYDELHIVGDIPEQQWLIAELRKYLQKAYIINPVADFNRAQVTEIKNMPYDLQTLFVKGR